MDEEQEIAQAVGQHVRVVATTVARLSEAAFRTAQVVAERRRALEENRAAELTARFEAERDAARAAYLSVEDPRWWESAAPEQVAEVYQVATVWSEFDEEGRRVQRLMAEEIQRRYDVDARAVDLAAVPAELAAAERARANRDAAEAIALTAAADRADRSVDEDLQEADRQDAAGERERIREAVLNGELTPERATEQWPADDPHKASVEHAAAAVDALWSSDAHREERGELDEKADRLGVAWDSAERREATAQALSSTVDDAQAVDARMRADAANAHPATEATRQPKKTAKARPARGQGTGRQREQSRGR
ncbi:MAG TPA: hypothetical protein VM575_09485 [Nocardioides sp.]|nr:hypothetical protein [Nocardioides sp.]